MTKDEVLKLALEALESGVDTQIGRVAWTEYDSCLIVEAITAIKESLAQDEKGLFIDLIAQHEGLAEELAQPEQEPVGWIEILKDIQVSILHGDFDCRATAANVLGELITNFEAQPEQEPVAPTCERCADEIVENNAGLCANCLPAICTEQEPVFKWRSVFQEMPTENSHLLFCFGVHVVEGSYTKKGWASLAYGEAQPDFWAYMPPAPHPKRNQELYAMPLQRPWVGLTDEKIAEVAERMEASDPTDSFWREFARAIEAAHNIGVNT